MDEHLIEIREYDGEGYQPLVDYGEWRVAILNFLEGIRPELNRTMERHAETDEVFVLTRGRGVLLTGGDGARVEGVRPVVMGAGKIYNVKRNVWHTILLSRDASVLIVENRDTGRHNTEYASLSAEQHAALVDAASENFGAPFEAS